MIRHYIDVYATSSTLLSFQVRWRSKSHIFYLKKLYTCDCEKILKCLELSSNLSQIYKINKKFKQNVTLCSIQVNASERLTSRLLQGDVDDGDK